LNTLSAVLRPGGTGNSLPSPGPESRKAFRAFFLERSKFWKNDSRKGANQKKGAKGWVAAGLRRGDDLGCKTPLRLSLSKPGFRPWLTTKGHRSS